MDNASVEQLRKDWEDLKFYNEIGDHVSCYLDKIQSCVGVEKMIESMRLVLKKHMYYKIRSIQNDVSLLWKIFIAYGKNVS